MEVHVGYTVEGIYSANTQRVLEILGPFMQAITNPETAEAMHRTDVCDFLAGNPQEMPLPEFVEAMQRNAAPQDKNWFAYKMNEAEPRQAVATALTERRGVQFRPEDIYLTTGAFGALVVALDTIVDPGDEVIFISPPWFFYEAMIVRCGGVPVRVRVKESSFDLDLKAIAAALTPRTRAIIINSPHNPTGRIYSPETLRALASLLEEGSRRAGRPIYLISDESYYRIVFDRLVFRSPTEFYPHSFLIYTYGKTLLTPGQRVGFIALPPEMPQRDQLGPAIMVSQTIAGHVFPNALLQHALPDLERLSIDIAHLQRKRDRLVAGLRAAGYQLHVPEGTFYLLPRSPLSDDLEFVGRLARRGIFCLPGSAMEMPGYFRLSATASDDMIERALPGFAAELQAAQEAAAA
jgi:aspartate aminotransferase